MFQLTNVRILTEKILPESSNQTALILGVNWIAYGGHWHFINCAWISIRACLLCPGICAVCQETGIFPTDTLPAGHAATAAATSMEKVSEIVNTTGAMRATPVCNRMPADNARAGPNSVSMPAVAANEAQQQPGVGSNCGSFEALLALAEDGPGPEWLPAKPLKTNVHTRAFFPTARKAIFNLCQWMLSGNNTVRPSSTTI